MQESMSLKYEPASVPLHISVKWLFLYRRGSQVFNKLSFMGANWDLPGCAWDGKACIVPVVQKFAKPLHVPVMNMG